MKNVLFSLISLFFLTNYAICQVKKTQDTAVIEAPSIRAVEDGKVADGEIFTTIDVMPQFPGGDQARMKFLSTNLRYPEAAVEKEIEGTVVVQFVVTRTGEIDRINIKRSPSPVLSEEAIRVVKKMPKWIPGENKGKKVDCYFSLPITFKLQ